MRVNKSDAVIVAQVLYNHVLQERGLARAGLADDIDMMAAVFRSYAEHAVFFPECRFSKPLYFAQMMFVQIIKLVPLRFYKSKRAIARPFAVCPNLLNRVHSVLNQSGKDCLKVGIGFCISPSRPARDILCAGEAGVMKLNEVYTP